MTQTTKTILIVALCGLSAMLVAQQADKPAAVPFNAMQVQQMQAFNERVNKINKEQADMRRTWDAELKVVQLEYQKWLADQCKTLKNEQCAADVQNPDSSKWTFALPPAKLAPPATAPPEAANPAEKKE